MSGDPPDTAPEAAPEASPATTWYDAGLRFSCTQCGDCCTGGPGYVWFDEAEGRAIAEHLGLEEREFYQRYAKRKLGRWTLEEVRIKRGQYDCVFLERDERGRGKCSVYHQRPTQCRTWPFWASNLKTPRAWAAAAEGCPGMSLPGEARGDFVPVEAIRVRLAQNPPGL